MKNMFLSVLVLVFVSPLFPQHPDIQIIDYFPVGVGNTWTYANASGTTTEVVIMRNSGPDNISNDGTSLYLFEQQFIGIGTTSTLYSIKQNKVVIVVEKNIVGQYQKTPPFSILALAGQEWQYNDRGDDLIYITSKASCAFDGKIYTDCILVEEIIVTDNEVLRIKKSYYANGVGLVYVTLQSPGEGESVYIKLADSNIAISHRRMVDILGLVFITLANVGIDQFPFAVPGILQTMHTGKENEFLKAILQTMTTYLQIISTMLDTGSIKITTFVNEPLPDSLISSSGDNTLIATGIDRALKVIVLSYTLNESNKNGRLTTDNVDLISGTQTAEPVIKQYFTHDPSIDPNHYAVMDQIYNSLIRIYLENGGK